MCVHVCSRVPCLGCVAFFLKIDCESSVPELGLVTETKDCV